MLKFELRRAEVMESKVCIIAKSAKDLKKIHWFDLRFSFCFSMASSMTSEKIISSKIPILSSSQERQSQG